MKKALRLLKWSHEEELMCLNSETSERFNLFSRFSSEKPYIRENLSDVSRKPYIRENCTST